MNRRTLLGLLLIFVIAGCANGDGPQQMHGTLERDRLELIAEAHERIVDLRVREGDRVAAGTVLLSQEAGTMPPRLHQARAALAQAERCLADAAQGPRQREIDEARAALEGAESTYATERREYDRVAALVERRLLSSSELDRASARRDAALATRDQASARLRLLREGTRPEQVREAEAAVEKVEEAPHYQSKPYVNVYPGGVFSGSNCLSRLKEVLKVTLNPSSRTEIAERMQFVSHRHPGELLVLILLSH